MNNMQQSLTCLGDARGSWTNAAPRVVRNFLRWIVDGDSHLARSSLRPIALWEREICLVVLTCLESVYGAAEVVDI